MGLFGHTEEERDLARILKVLPGRLDRFREVVDLQAEIESLKNERAELQRQAAATQETFDRKERQTQEDFDRKSREIQHMVGLERKRQEAEREQSKRDLEQEKIQARLEVQATNLTEDRKRFDQRIQEQKDHFDLQRETLVAQQQTLENLMVQILSRLPQVSVSKTDSTVRKLTGKMGVDDKHLPEAIEAGEAAPEE